MLECWRSSDQQPQTQNRPELGLVGDAAHHEAGLGAALQFLEEWQAERGEPGVLLNAPSILPGTSGSRRSTQQSTSQLGKTTHFQQLGPDNPS